jgi:hypothetical protein
MYKLTLEDYPGNKPVWKSGSYRIGQNANGHYIFLDKPVDIPDLWAGDIVPSIIHDHRVPENEAAKKLATVK